MGTHLTACREQNNAASVLQQDGFKALDQTIQNFIRNVAAGLSHTEDVLRSEHAMTRQVISEESRKIERNLGAQISSLSNVHLDGDKYDNLLKSLEYPEMHWRSSQIGDAGSKTFEWVFDDILPGHNDRKQRPWASFSSWLASGTGIYWVHGKPGSGKSTLMKHLWQHDKTRQLLDDWCPTKRLVIVYCGFWLSGSPMQRSLRGILCSLLYHVLCEHKESLPGLVEPNSKLIGKKSHQDWSPRELFTFLRTTVHRLVQTSAFCFFLDGLDELDKSEDPRELLSLINTLVSEVNVKVCVSSRPEQIYCDEFRMVPSLKLQDLTADDIRTFTMEQLSDVQTSGRLDDSESDIRDSIIKEIVTKADGVFLWVRLALRDVLRGLAARASWKELLARISRLPVDVERLYEDILKRNAEDWGLIKEEAALYFAILLLNEEYFSTFWSTGQLVIFAIISSKWRQGWSGWRPDLSIEELRKVCHHTMVRIQNVCGGMLEVTDYDEVVEPATDLDNAEEFSFLYRRVRFFHRTVYDFLMDNPAGQAIPGCSTITEKDLFHAMIEVNMFIRICGDFRSFWTDIAFLIETISSFHRHHSYVSDEIVANLNQVDQYLPQIAHAALAEELYLPHEIDLSVAKSNRSCEYQFATYSTSLKDTRTFPPIPHDFMGLTLGMGVSAYLENFLRTYSNTQLQNPQLHQQYKNYLLLCACWGYNDRYLPDAGLRSVEKVMVQLLSMGADPNAKVFLHPSLPNIATPGSTLLNRPKHRMMTINFCELFRHFLEKGLRLDDPELVYYTQSSGWRPIVDKQFFDFMFVRSPGMLSQATRRLYLVSCWDAMVQICPDLTSFDRPETESDKLDMDVILVRSKRDEPPSGLRTVIPTSDQSKQLLSIVDMLEQLDADPAIRNSDRSEKTGNLRSLFNQKLQEIEESSKEEVDFENYLAGMGLPMASSDPVALSGPIPMYEDSSGKASTSDGIATYCKVCEEQRQELLKYRWTSPYKLEKKPLELLISQGLEVGESDAISVADET